MTNAPFLLAVGAFLTSAGFGGLVAVAAAMIAYRNVTRTIAANHAAATEAADIQRELARKEDERARERELAADARQRWWEALVWVADNASKLTPVEASQALAALTSRELNPQQSAMLEAVTRVVGRSAMKGPGHG